MTDWFVTNVADAHWRTNDAFGSSAQFETLDNPFEQLGINIRVLEPGKPNCLYHRENQQEDFLVLQGEALLLIDGEERPVKAWDLIHIPPEVDHVMVGAGDGPCVVLMVGARLPKEELYYPVSELAESHGASATEGTPSPEEAYARFGESRSERPGAWEQLPWASK